MEAPDPTVSLQTRMFLGMLKVVAEESSSVSDRVAVVDVNAALAATVRLAGYIVGQAPEVAADRKALRLLSEHVAHRFRNAVLETRSAPPERLEHPEAGSLRFEQAMALAARLRAKQGPAP